MSTLEVLSAYDQKHIDSLPRAAEAELEKMLSRAQELYLNRDSWLPKYERIAILEKTAAIVSERAEELALAAAREGGKPLTDSRVELGRAVRGIKTAASELSHMAGREIPMELSERTAGRFAQTYREPRGVVAAVSAFNHPFNLIVHQVVTAVAAGCPVIVKPASTTPLSCRSLLGVLYEAGLPRDWAQLLIASTDVATKLVTDPRLGFFTFIGSARVGWSLRSKLAPGVACALEHGGVAPAIVDETADVAAAVPLLLKAGYYHAGQVCVSTQRIYLHESIASSFTEQFVEGAKKLHVGDPTDPETEVGPLILPKEVDRVAEWVAEARERGGKILCGGERLSETTYSPTVISNPPDDTKVTREEVFGPVVCLYTYSDRGEVIRRANAVDTYFQASIFTKNVDVAWDTARRLNGMAVMVNDHTAFRADWMPFGGHRGSGLGTGGIGFSMHDMTLERMVVFKSPSL